MENEKSYMVKLFETIIESHKKMFEEVELLKKDVEKLKELIKEKK